MKSAVVHPTSALNLNVMNKMSKQMINGTWENIIVSLPCHTKLNFWGRASFCSTTSWKRNQNQLGDQQRMDILA